VNRSRIASVLLACLLVTAGAAGPATQSASALQFGNFGEC